MGRRDSQGLDLRGFRAVVERVARAGSAAPVRGISRASVASASALPAPARRAQPRHARKDTDPPPLPENRLVTRNLERTDRDCIRSTLRQTEMGPRSLFQGAGGVKEKPGGSGPHRASVATGVCIATLARKGQQTGERNTHRRQQSRPSLFAANKDSVMACGDLSCYWLRSGKTNPEKRLLE
jgi:hypothetical protein